MTQHPGKAALDAMVETAAKATPGPWSEATVPGITSREDMLKELREGWLDGKDSVPDELLWVGAGYWPQKSDDPVTVCVVGNGPMRHENRAHIAAANPAAVQAVAGYVRALEAEVAKLREVKP